MRQLKRVDFLLFKKRREWYTKINDNFLKNTMDFANLEFLFLVIAVLANLFLAVIVLIFAPKNNTRHLFSVFCVVQSAWVIVNYISFLQNDLVAYVTWVRVVAFCAMIHAFLFFWLAYFLLSTKRSELSRKSVIAMFLSLIIMLSLAFTPLFFKMATENYGRVSLIHGPLIFLFGIFSFGYISAGFYHIIKKYRESVAIIEKVQWKYILIGLAMTFSLILVFSFLSVVVLNARETVRFGHLYTLPFVIFSAYAIIKHHLMSVRVIFAELGVVLLNIILFIRLIVSTDLSDFSINLLLFFGSLIIGIVSIKSLLREERIKEELKMRNIKLETWKQSKYKFPL